MRLLTRSDFDGICCAVLLKEQGIIEEMVYAHPKDLQDGKVVVTPDDVLANVPFVEGCGLWFDHHSSESERLDLAGMYEGRSAPGPSAARHVYEYYGLKKLAKFDEMVTAVDKVDSAQLSESDILDPKGWVLLGFICDPRTGLGYRKGYRIGNLALMKDLVEYMRTRSISEILDIPDVRERVDYYTESVEAHRALLSQRSRVEGRVVISDFRGVAEIPPGNRFLVYAMFPETNISIRLLDGRNKEFVSISTGYSILNRTATVDVGSLMLSYGGGGHKAVGTCQVPYEDADRILTELVEATNPAAPGAVSR